MQVENVNKLCNNNRTVHANDRNKKKKKNQITSYSNWPCVLLFDLAHKQCNGIVKRWLHCISAKGTFIVNNILMFGSAWCLVMSHIQLSLIKNIKIGRPKHLLIPPTSDHISFLLRPPYPPSNWTSYVYHP